MLEPGLNAGATKSAPAAIPFPTVEITPPVAPYIFLAPLVIIESLPIAFLALLVLILVSSFFIWSGVRYPPCLSVADPTPFLLDSYFW